MIDIKLGTLLYTIDGRKVGNGIVVSIKKQPDGSIQHAILTDSGDVVHMLKHDVVEYFYVSKERQEPWKWWRGRIDKVRAGCAYIQYPQHITQEAMTS